MKSENCKVQHAIGIIFSLLLTLALSGCGGGGGSSQVLELPPATPTGVQVTISAANELTLSWAPVANATSYNVYWSAFPGVNKQSTKISGNTATNYVHKALTNGTTYHYVVTALNSYGESGVSTEVSAALAASRPPSAVAAVAGDGQVTLSWNGDGATTSFNIYMASQAGVTKLNGTPLSNVTSPHTITTLQNGTTYYFVVTSSNGFFGESSESHEVAATPAATAGSLTVSGSVRYEDKEYGASGFTGKTSYKAVRYAAVEAVDVASGTAIATATTDAAGLYSLTLPAAASAKAVYIRTLSSASSPLSSTTPLAGVQDFSNALYAVAGSNFTASGAAVANISIPATSLAAGAFNALDVFTSAAQFIQSLSANYPPVLAAYWQAGNPNGTYYCSGIPDPFCPYGEGIYILSANGDTDEYDDDVLWHEYGHFIANRYSKDDSPGGVHYLSSNDLDLRLSWSEGWGDFFPGAVKAWLKVNAPSLLSTVPAMATSVYVDSSGASGSSFDFGNPSGASYIYASNEAAVAKVLLDLMASPSYGMQAIWDTFTSMKTATTQVNFEVFWDCWNLLAKPDITAILGARSIAYSADSYEVDDSKNPSRKAVIGTAENHTLFGSADIDYIAFDAIAGTSYTAKTSALNNGADTVISIIRPDLSVANSNDNTSGKSYANTVPSAIVPSICDGWGECHENGYDLLGSTASFTPTVAGTYYVEVKSSPNRPLSAGRYGGYTLTITSP